MVGFYVMLKNKHQDEFVEWLEWILGHAFFSFLELILAQNSADYLLKLF
jgi:hypothetical protein